MKTKLPMFHLIFLILLMVGAGFLFYRTENNIKATRKLQLEVSRQETNISKLGDLSVLLPTLTSETSTYLRTLPMSESDVAAYATLVETLAKDSDLTIANHFDDFRIGNGNYSGRIFSGFDKILRPPDRPPLLLQNR